MMIQKLYVEIMLDKVINYLKLKFNKDLGFTLIELLITISIIAILAVIGVSIYSNVSSSVKDARRKADIKAIANALEVNYARTGICNKDDGTTVPSNAYCPLQNSWFSGGALPKDPNTGIPGYSRYCWWVNKDTSALYPTTPGAVWTGGCNLLSPSSTWKVPTPDDPPGVCCWANFQAVQYPPEYVKWKICAWIESENKAFCLTNRQN